jgi:hypothetical protein
MNNVNKNMMLNEIKTHGMNTIFDSPDPKNKKIRNDLSEKLERALEKNEVIHRAICTKISRLMGCSNLPT